MSTTRFVLVRHGETPLNREMRYIGLRDDELTETGSQQAQQLASALAIFPVAAIYSSPLKRAYLTALPIAEQQNLPVQRIDALKEGDFGLWEGLTGQEVKARGQHEAALLRAWQNDPTIAPPQGESLEAMSKRVLTAVATIAEEYAQRVVVLVTHTGPLKAVLCAALGVSLVTAFRIFLDPASISVVDWQEPRPIVRLVNSHAHLGWDQARWL